VRILTGVVLGSQRDYRGLSRRVVTGLGAVAQVVSIRMKGFIGHDIVGFVGVGVVRMATHDGFDGEFAHPITTDGIANEAATGRARGVLLESIFEEVLGAPGVDGAVLGLVYELVNGNEIGMVSTLGVFITLVLLAFLKDWWSIIFIGGARFRANLKMLETLSRLHF